MDTFFFYIVCEIILSVHISLSNLLVLWVFCRTRSVRTVTNTYIFSLALTDFLAGAFGIPATVYSVLTQQPRDFSSCLFVHLILCILCTISTFHMLAIALDKYITICRGNAFMKSRRSRAVLLIGIAWVAGSVIGIMPMFDAFGFKTDRIGNYEARGAVCQFTHIMDYRYLVYVIFFATILAPSAVIIFCYIAIHQRIRHEESQVKCFLGQNERERRMNGRRKLIRILLILVSTYAICWYPLYIMNTMAYLLPPSLHPSANMQLCAVVLSHLSCAINPVIYAYGMPGFKKALRAFFNMIPPEEAYPGQNTACNYSAYVRSTMGGRQSHCPASFANRRPAAVSDISRRKISAPAPVIKRSLQHSGGAYSNRARLNPERRGTIQV
ncbi:hypothetical protein PENTCL1PPCAC_6023 [Pristionchus entomophagus]|uniref:G-protein coupled receptors family 1 profile domain-containing protein n=1 Tax=Pristionchus entomophagus TaxID=358040 RepID=A0AAV5STD4_9BILA|nr:hypothetical protein PENTCL1PPCAC_6023 [Pristionchus entomophagus]